MATMDNDAKSCYDRIVASLALLTSKHFGVSTEVCETVGATLEAMHFKIRTAMGDSPISYSHTDATPIHGVGQGGTASPAFWLLVSSILIDCYQQGAKGMTIRNPSQSVVLRQWIEALVDDTSIFTNLDQCKDVVTLVRELEKDTQQWEKLLSTPLEIANVAAEIKLQELGKPDYTTISIKHPSEAHRTLGVWKSMDGNVDEQLQVLAKRSKNMAAIVSTSGMYPYQADVALRMIYTPSMCYSLPAVHIPENKLDRIQYKALESFVPTMGFNKGFPRAVILGPTDFGGEGVPHLYTESKLQQIEILMMHLRAQTELGKLFHINLQWMQLHAGIGQPYLESTVPIPYIKNWSSGLREFLIQIQGKLIVKDILPPTIERQGDCLIMEAIARFTPELSANHLRYIYNWRLFYQVQKLSDLTNAKGDKILPVYLQYPGESDIRLSRSDRISKLTWPYQIPPSSKATFKLWVKTIRVCFLATTGPCLRQRLGSWITSPEASQSLWHSYTDPSFTSLLDTTTSPYSLYESVTKRTACTTIFDDNFSMVNDIPSDFIPVVMIRRGTQIIAQHEKTRTNIASLSTPISSYPDIQHEIRHNMAQFDRILLQHFRIYDSDKLLECLRNSQCTLLMVSDGSHKDDKGAFGVAVGTDTDDLYHIEGPAPYTEEITTPFRSEAYGLMANLKFLKALLKTYSINMTNRKVKVYSDNLELISCIHEQITQVTSPRTFLQHDADVITQIIFDINKLKSRGINLTFEHVKGHQDKDNPYASLSRQAQLNVQANAHALNYFHNGRKEVYAELQDNPVSLSICDRVINDELKLHIRNASRSPDIRQYMIKKFLWRPRVPDMIWWQIHGTTIQLMSNPDRHRIKKYIFQWLPTCERMNMYNKEVSDKCQSCNDSTIETHKHLLRCPCENRQASRARWFLQFDQFLSNTQYTPVIVRNLFYNAIHARCSNQRAPDVDIMLYHVDIQEAYNQQTQIGWEQLLYGRLAIGWSTAIENYLRYKNVAERDMTATKWGQTVIQHIFRFIIQTWLQRNDEAHVRNSANESLLTRQRLIAQIIYLQESSPDIRYCDRDFVHKPPEILAGYSLINLRAWHRAALSIIKSNKRRNRKNRSQPLITQHFATTRPIIRRPRRQPHRPRTSTQVAGRPRVRERLHHSRNMAIRSFPRTVPIRRRTSTRSSDSVYHRLNSSDNPSTSNGHTPFLQFIQQIHSSSSSSTTSE